MPAVLLVLLIIIVVATCSGDDEPSLERDLMRLELSIEHHDRMKRECATNLEIMISHQCDCLLNRQRYVGCLDKNPATGKYGWEEWRDKQRKQLHDKP